VTPSAGERVVVLRDGRTDIVRCSVAPPSSGSWVLIAPRLVGLCSSDVKEVLGTRVGRSDFGHELVGRVIASGRCSGLPSGLRVALDPHVAISRTTAFADKMLAYGEPSALVRAFPAVPEDIPDDRAVFVEPLACVCHCAAHLADVAQGSRICVVGAGTAGVLIAIVLRERGFEVTLANRGPERLARLHAAGVVRDVRLALLRHVDESFDAVILMTAMLDLPSLEAAWAMLPPRGGSLVLFGGTAASLPVPGTSIDLARLRRTEGRVEVERNDRSVTVAGSYGATATDFDAAVTALLRPYVRFEDLIAARLGLEDLVQLLNTVSAGAPLIPAKHVVEIGL
jgi:cyclitol reductase